jgi:hypothetical protein
MQGIIHLYTFCYLASAAQEPPLVNTLASGRGPSTFATWLCVHHLQRSHKPNGSVRPIAVGEVIRRLVVKCLMARVKQSAQALLAPLQMGVAVQGGAEAIIHTTR